MHCRDWRHAHFRRRLAIAAAATAALLSLPRPGAAMAASRDWQPLVIKGAQMPALVGDLITRFEVLATHDGKLGPIPFQVDQLTADGKYALPDGPEPTLGDSPGILGKDDEIALMISDLGEPAGAAAQLPAGAQEIEVADPLGGPDRFAYVAAVDSPERSPVRYVEYDPKIDRVETDSYRMSFTNELPTDLALQNRKHEGGANIIDRIKVRASARVLGIFHYRMDEDDIRNRLLAWKSGPVRIIRRISHSVDVILGIRSPEVVSENYFYRDYIENPFRLRFPWVPRVIFGDIHVRIDLDFSDAAGWELLWSGMKQPPVRIGDAAAERALAGEDPAQPVAWMAMRAAHHTFVQTLRPSADLRLVDRRLYFRDDPGVPDPPERVPGEHPGVGYMMTGWEELSGGAHVIDSLLISVSGSYDPDLLLRELRIPVSVRARPVGRDK
jgi:hypothetical protein